MYNIGVNKRLSEYAKSCGQNGVTRIEQTYDKGLKKLFNPLLLKSDL